MMALVTVGGVEGSGGELALLEAIEPSAADSALARESSHQLASLLGQLQARGGETEGDGVVELRIGGHAEVHQVVALPTSVLRLLARLLAEMAQGNAVSLVPVDAEVSARQAAEVLLVSRPFLIGLLDTGKIPYRRVGTHRRLLLRDVLAYKRRDDEQRRAVLDALVAEAQEMDMGYGVPGASQGSQGGAQPG
jgi:excisionase family DNA binding protein